MSEEELSKPKIVVHMTQHILSVVIFMIGIVLLKNTANFLYLIGYFRDENPGLTIPVFINGVSWIAFFTSFVLPILYLILWYGLKKKKLAIFLLLVLIVISSLWVGGRLMFSTFAEENDAVSVLGNSSSINFHEINLHSFDELLSDRSDVELIVYVARDDCKKCNAFENELLPFLENLQYGLPTYYTNSDRDGPRSNEMYQLLEKYDIVSVPCVLIVKNSTVIKMWDEPLRDSKEIVAYIREHQYGKSTVRPNEKFDKRGIAVYIN